MVGRLRVARHRAIYEFGVRAPERDPAAKAPAGRPGDIAGGPAGRVALVVQARAARNAAELLRASTLTAPAARRVENLARHLDRLVRDLQDAAGVSSTGGSR